MAIAGALRERGHEVAFFSGEAVRETVESEGFELFAFERLDQERAFRSMRAIEGGRADPARVLRDWLVETIPDQLTDLRRVLDRWQPDVIATDLSLWGPIVVLHEAEPVPVALSSTFMGPADPRARRARLGLRAAGAADARAPARSTARSRASRSSLGRSLRRRVDEIRAEHGLGPLPEPVNRYTGRLPLYLVGNVRELDYDRRDLPASVHYVGNCIWYPPTPPETAEALADIRTDRPWVHVADSTLASGEPRLLRAAVEGLARRAGGGADQHRRRAGAGASSVSARCPRTCTSRAGTTTASCCRAARRS